MKKIKLSVWELFMHTINPYETATERAFRHGREMIIWEYFKVPIALGFLVVVAMLLAAEAPIRKWALAIGLSIAAEALLMAGLNWLIKRHQERSGGD